MTLSQADVLSQIETAKQQGMTLEQENGIVKIAKDAQVGFCSSLVWFGVDMTKLIAIGQSSHVYSVTNKWNKS